MTLKEKNQNKPARESAMAVFLASLASWRSRASANVRRMLDSTRILLKDRNKMVTPTLTLFGKAGEGFRSLSEKRYQQAAIVAAGIVGLAIAVFTGVNVYQHLVQTDPKLASATGAPLPVQTKVVQRAEVAQVIGAEAIAAESQLVPIRTSLMTARVTRIPVKLGDVVREGQLLIEFEGNLQKIGLASAQAQLDGYRREFDLIHKHLTGMEDLYKRGLASDDELRKAVQEDTDQIAKVTTAELKYGQANEDYQATRILAPVSGIITERELNPGTVVRQGIDLIKLSAIDPIYVTATLSEDKIKYVFVNQEANLSFYAFPGRNFQGKVAIIKPSVDQKSRLVSVIIRIDNRKLEVKPGMNGVAQLKSRAEALRVPGIALLSSKENSAYVFVVDNNDVAHVRPVTTGASAGGFVTIESGLAEGERVVVVGQTALVDNASVRIGADYVANK